MEVTKQKDDCLRCCIAAMIGKDPKEVPNFVKKAEKKGSDWRYDAARWLKRKGFNFLYVEKAAVGSCSKQRVIVCGKTKRNTYHAIIGQVGNHPRGFLRLTYLDDPHPSMEFLIKDTHYIFINKEVK